MSTTVQQPGKDSSKSWVTFKESLYITRAWDWFTTLISRAAEAILLGCFLVSLYSLIPGAPKIAPQVDAAVIIIQSITLDIAGIGLMKMSLRLKLDKKSFPYRLGQYLIAIMFVSIAVAIVRNVTGAADDNILLKIVESSLLVARAALAVLYGPAIHSLNEILREQCEEKSIASQVEERLSQAVQEELKGLTDRFAEMQKGFQSLSVFQSKLPEIERQIEGARAETERLKAEKLKGFDAETERQIESRFTEIESQIETNLKALKAFIERQTERPRVTVSEVPGIPAQKKAPISIAARAQATGHFTAGQSKRDFVFACLQEDATMSISEIQRRAEKAGLPMATGTVSTYRKAFNEGETESDIESAG